MKIFQWHTRRNSDIVNFHLIGLWGYCLWSVALVSHCREAGFSTMRLCMYVRVYVSLQSTYLPLQHVHYPLSGSMSDSIISSVLAPYLLFVVTG